MALHYLVKCQFQRTKCARFFLAHPVVYTGMETNIIAPSVKGENAMLLLHVDIFPQQDIHKSPSKRTFWNGIYSWLRRPDARESADTIYCM